MKPIICWGIILLIGLTVPLVSSETINGDAGSAANASANESANVSANVSANASSNISEELAAFVEEAAVYTRENGREKALLEFNKTDGEFTKGHLYIFANDFNGVSLAHPYRPEFVGEDQIGLKDANGVSFMKNLVTLARRGSGFGYYVYANPSHENKEELKVVYVTKIDDSWWIGSGAYLSEMSANFSQESRDNLTEFVDRAVDFARENGQENATKEFNDRNGQFIQDGLYIFAYDFEGNALALPYQPDLIGKNRLDIQDLYGIKSVQDMIAIAKEGSGFTYYIYPEVTKDMADTIKLTYVKKVDENWWLASGIFKS